MSTASSSPIEVRVEAVIPAPAERVWDLLSDFRRWPSWHRASRWIRIESGADTDRPTFRWKAHPILLRCTVVATDRPHLFVFTADGRGVHAEHAFTLCPTSDRQGTVVVSHETQVGWLAWVGRLVLARRLRAANRAWLADLALAVGSGAATQVTRAAG